MNFIKSNYICPVNKNLHKPIEFLKGVGPERGEKLKKEAKIHTCWDLFNYFPFRYVDRSSFQPIGHITGQEGNIQVKGVITNVRNEGIGKKKRLKANLRDKTGNIELVWFKKANWIVDKLKIGSQFIVYGKPQKFGARWSIVHPDFRSTEEVISEKKLQPVYNSSEKLTKVGLHSKGIEKLTTNLVKEQVADIPEFFPTYFREKYNLLSRKKAYKYIHHPENFNQLKAAQYTLKFEELFVLQMELLLRKKTSKKKSKGIQVLKSGQLFNDFYENHIPFELTGAQKRVIKEVFEDLKSGERMNRLLQGDVGSGKTLVALICALFLIDSNYQVALMAPTEILAQQHFNTIQEQLEKLPVNVALLTGSSKKKERRVIHEGLENGTVNLLIGTHALIEPTVKFKNLGMVIVDEQHRFGVAQRAKLAVKNSPSPHVLVMTATPIPRTLSMTLYGDLDVSIIDEMPKGRKPVQTAHYFEGMRLKVFEFLKKQIALGRQAYIVYPLIEESDAFDYKNLMEGFEAISKAFPKPNYQISIVHGRMKPEDKDFEMQRFAKGETHIMVATTVIEVGVNVPNASVMVIENAEKFGLSQLHQLRGRVGRGSEKSYCLLMSGNKISQEGKKRLKTMVSTNDGFKIAEVDLEIRGPGNIMGTQQSGILDLNIANLATDGTIISRARDAAKFILNNDPKFEKSEHQGMKIALKEFIKSKPNWSKIA